LMVYPFAMVPEMSSTFTLLTGIGAGFFFLAAKYGGIDFGWCIYGGNHPHLLRNVF
jgi:hypothetical protein